MQQLLSILNAPFGLLVAGAIISGLLVQSITFKWQQRNWIFQQRFTSERTKFDKELEQKYKILEDINGTVATTLTHSQWVVVGHMKGVGVQQQNVEVQDYNGAVMKWEMDFRIYVIRLQTFFADKELPTLWEAIKKDRDSLDVAIYMLTARNRGSSEDALKLIDKISRMTVDLSQRMFGEINRMKQRDFGGEVQDTRR